MFQAQMPLTGLADVGGTARDVMTEAAAAATTYQALRDARDWTGLGAHTRVLRGVGAWIEADIAQRGLIASAARQQLSEADRSARNAFAALREGEDAAAEAMRDHLVQLLEEEGRADPRTDAERLLAGEGALFERASRFATLHDQLEEESVEASVRMHVLAMSGEIAAFVPLAAQDTDRVLAARRTAVGADAATPVPPLDGDRDLVAALTTETRQGLSDGQARLFDALANDLGVPELRERAHHIALDSGLRPGHAARLLGAFLALARQNTDPARFVSDHRLALELAEAMQRLLVLGAYARFTTAHLASRDANRWYSHETRRLTQRSFDSHVPSGPDTPLDDLGQAAADALVRVEGVVEDLRIEDDPAPPKFSTFLTLRDPVGGTAIKVRAHLFSLAANGVANGVYLRLNGWVRRADPWLAADETGLDIDRVALSELSRASWLDDVTFRMRDFCTLYLDGMSLFHTPSLPAGESVA